MRNMSQGEDHYVRVKMQITWQYGIYCICSLFRILAYLYG